MIYLLDTDTLIYMIRGLKATGRRQSLRQRGSTKYSLRRMVELAVTGIAAHSVRPLRFAIWLALAVAAVGAGLVVYSIVSFF